MQTIWVSLNFLHAHVVSIPTRLGFAQYLLGYIALSTTGAFAFGSSGGRQRNSNTWSLLANCPLCIVKAACISVTPRQYPLDSTHCQFILNFQRSLSRSYKNLIPVTLLFFLLISPRVFDKQLTVRSPLLPYRGTLSATRTISLAYRALHLAATAASCPYIFFIICFQDLPVNHALMSTMSSGLSLTLYNGRLTNFDKSLHRQLFDQLH